MYTFPLSSTWTYSLEHFTSATVGASFPTDCSTVMSCSFTSRTGDEYVTSAGSVSVLVGRGLVAGR